MINDKDLMRNLFSFNELLLEIHEIDLVENGNTNFPN